MKLSASQAAKETGKSIPTITRAIKSGKLSASKTDTGGFEIDPAELFRVFPPLTQAANDTPTKLGDETPNVTGVSSALEVEIKMLRERLADKDSEIDHLRGLLDQEAAERRKLTMLITDQTARPAPPVAADKPKRRWWHIGRAND